MVNWIIQGIYISDNLCYFSWSFLKQNLAFIRIFSAQLSNLTVEILNSAFFGAIFDANKTLKRRKWVKIFPRLNFFRVNFSFAQVNSSVFVHTTESQWVLEVWTLSNICDQYKTVNIRFKHYIWIGNYYPFLLSDSHLMLYLLIGVLNRLYYAQAQAFFRSRVLINRWYFK